VILISNIVLEVLEGSTVASTEIYGADKKTYVNIGSGNVFNLKWTTTLTGEDTVNYYNLVIKRYDPTLNVYYDIFDKNIGLVNKFYVDSPLLPALPEQYMLSVYVVAYGKSGSVITSNVVNPYVCKGSGTYIKVQPDNYTQPIMKRALAFTNVSLPDEAAIRIVDTEGNEVPVLDNEGNQILLEAKRLLTSSTNWQLVPESFVKSPEGTWQTTDIKYEVLVDETGEIITDSSNAQIYVL
jgi:hypothetical protein